MYISIRLCVKNTHFVKKKLKNFAIFLQRIAA